MKQRWNQKLAKCIEWIYPRRCPVCDEAAPHGTLICPECYGKLIYVSETYCMKCGKPVGTEEEYCEDCLKQGHVYDRGRAVFVYEGVIRHSAYRMKYGKRQEYAAFFGGQMAKRLAVFVTGLQAEALIPVPMTDKKLKERGYNQAALLAKEISLLTGIPVRNDLVVKVKDTAPQKQLDAAERQNNLKKAFKMKQNDVKLNVTIIIDDIYTTGSTVDAVARLLKENGVKKVFFLALAIGKARVV